ncbi:MAG: hypothetical protein R3242_07475 [Akkermansiaceae bacterium]|nr:hypothetical protein [Akkermansiaceae bacterium]
MKPFPAAILPSLALVLVACSGTRQVDPDAHAYQGLSGRLSQSHGYKMDDQGNWVPRTDKRSQYEFYGDSAQFDGSVSRKSFNTNRLEKGSWMGSKEYARPRHRHTGSNSGFASASRLDGQDAALERRLRTPARITGNHIARDTAQESHGNRADKPENAAVQHRREVYVEPAIIDYRQQRELSIQQSKQLLGRDD